VDEKDAKFDAWMMKVDALLEGRLGLGSSDLEDQPYWDWFDSGLKPSEVASEVVSNIAYDYGIGSLVD
jgi:hypothetical protein